jgi:peptidoglycan L-alanyl-D-glutamate endopeptidase CwlK
MCPGALTANITSNLPLVMNALLAAKITPPLLVLASIATIRAETAGFAPLDEGISQFNTSPGGHPFDLYDNRSDLGNLGAPDGASFKGRGFVQLTGRANYTRIGGQIGVDLVGTPNLANDPATSAAILATFIANNRVVISNALAANNLGAARAAVNGGHNGLSNFVDAYNTGRAALGV